MIAIQAIPTYSARMTDAKKTLLHVFPSLEIGGSQRRFATLLNNGGDQFHHKAIALNGNYAIADHIASLECLHGVGTNMPKGSTFKAAKMARAYLGNIKPDLLVTYNWGSIEWAMGNRFNKICPMIHIQDGYGPEEQRSEKPLRRLFRAFTYRGCDRVIVPSHRLKHIAANNWHIPRRKLSFIPNGIHLDKFTGEADADLLQSFGFNEDDIIIGTVAGLRPEKNIGRLIEAFYVASDGIPSARLLIVGDGPARPALEVLVDRTSLRGAVVFAGPMDQPQRILPALRAFALSSDTEQMPLSVIEAMAASLPIASTDVGDLKQMVAPENTTTINGNDTKALATSMRQYMVYPKIAKDVGNANHAKAMANYSHTNMIKAYEDTFTDVIAKGA